MEERNDHNTPISDLREAIAVFDTARGWDDFHSPKNLAMAIAIEAAELMEIFQWVDNDVATRQGRSGPERARVAEELADVAIYTLTLCNALDLDLSQIIRQKIIINGQRYPETHPAPNRESSTAVRNPSASAIPSNGDESEDMTAC